MLKWLKRKFGNQSPSSVHSQIDASDKDYGVLLYEQLVSHIERNREKFDWRNSNRQTGLPSNPAIARRIEEVLDNLDEYFEEVVVEKRAKKWIVIRLTKYQRSPNEFSRKDEDWFGAKTFSRFIQENGAHAENSEVFDYVSLYLGYPGFLGFQKSETLTAKTEIKDSQRKDSPAAKSNKVESGNDDDKSKTRRVFGLKIPKTSTMIVVALITLACLIGGLIVNNHLVMDVECSGKKELLSALVMDFLNDDDDPFSTKLVAELGSRVTDNTPLRILPADRYVNTKSLTYRKEVEKLCAQHCLGKGVAIYGELESELGFVDCQIDVINLARGDSVITEDHYYLNDPGTYRFNLPQRAVIVADFVWALLYYHQGKDQIAVSILEKLLSSNSNKVDGTFLSSAYLLLGNAHMHLGNYILAMNSYENISDIDGNADIANKNRIVCQELLKRKFTALSDETTDTVLDDNGHLDDSSLSAKVMDTVIFAGHFGSDSDDTRNRPGTRTDTIQNSIAQKDTNRGSIQHGNLRPIPHRDLKKPTALTFVKPQILDLDSARILRSDPFPILNQNQTNEQAKQPSPFHFISELQSENEPAFISPNLVVSVNSSAPSADEIKIEVRALSPDLKKVLSRLELDPFGLLGKAEKLKFAELKGGKVWRESVCLDCAIPKGGWELFQFRIECSFAPFCLAGMRLTGFDNNNKKLFTEYVLRHSLVEKLGEEVMLSSLKKIYGNKEGTDK